MKTNSVDLALNRTLALKWSFDQGKLRSYVSLVKEYLRRAALWAKRLQATEHWPFFDVASLVAPEVRADQTAIDQLEAALTPLSPWPTIKKTCIWYLHWEALKRERPEVVAAYNLPEPFEPLLRLYECGGYFTTEHGFINVSIVGIPAKVRGWQEYDSATPVVDLDEKTLDKVHVAGGLS